MHRTFSYFDLVETFPESGCAVCKLLLRDVHRLLDSILYEYVMDLEIKAKLRASRGLCNEHGWQFVKLGNALGISVLYEGVIDELLNIIDNNAPRNISRFSFTQNPNLALASALAPAQPCLACNMANENESQYLHILSEHITDEKMQQAYRDSEGLCLEHFRQLLHHAPDAERSKVLITIQRAIWERLSNDLKELIRKNNFQNAYETLGAEGDSWQRVVARMSGERGVFGTRRPNAKKS